LITTFDGTSRETCTLRRIRTNTPLQALTLLNDAAFFEAAQALGRRMIQEAGPGPGARAAYGFRLVTARRPSPEDLNDALSLYEKGKAWFKSHSDAAKVVEGIGDVPASVADHADWAAWIMVANAFLNLDETQTKE
jgi:hypothetical protein